MSGSQTARLERFTRTPRELSFQFSYDGENISTHYCYEQINFLALEQRYSSAILQRVYALIAALELTKFANLRCQQCDLGELSEAFSPGVAVPWSTIVNRVWAEWRYHHSAPLVPPPELICRGTPSHSSIVLSGAGVATLAFCGGGKDSLLSMRLLEAGGIPFSSFSYSRTCYGSQDQQHRLMSGLASTSSATRHHRLWINDSFHHFCKQRYAAGAVVGGITEAETPLSVAAALPYALAFNYTDLVVGHERSADSGNGLFDGNGQEINHQWGKSFEAELLLNELVRNHVISGISYFSPLKPIHDSVIFTMLRDYQTEIGLTHSCNVSKPWCGRCAKCCYVLSGFFAYLDDLPPGLEAVPALLDEPNNQPLLAALAGRGSHRPFECVGEAGEMLLALALCARKGLRLSKALDAAASEADLVSLIDRYTAVAMNQHLMPASVQAKLLPLLQQGAHSARTFLLNRLGLDEWQHARDAAG